MLSQFGIANIASEQLVECRGRLSIVISWNAKLELFQDGGRKSIIDNIVCEVPKIGRALHRIGLVFQAAKPKHLLIIFGRKCFHPWLQFLCNEGLENTRKSI